MPHSLLNRVSDNFCRPIIRDGKINYLGTKIVHHKHIIVPVLLFYDVILKGKCVVLASIVVKS